MADQQRIVVFLYPHSFIIGNSILWQLVIVVRILDRGFMRCGYNNVRVSFLIYLDEFSVFADATKSQRISQSIKLEYVAKIYDALSTYIRQHRTIFGTRLACGYSRYSSQKSSEIRQGLPAVFVSIDENPDSTIRAPRLCGIALNGNGYVPGIAPVLRTMPICQSIQMETTGIRRSHTNFYRELV